VKEKFYDCLSRVPDDHQIVIIENEDPMSTILALPQLCSARIQTVEDWGFPKTFLSPRAESFNRAYSDGMIQVVSAIANVGYVGYVG